MTGAGDGPVVLVTGATGTVGRTVADLLHARGVAVRAGSRDPGRAAASSPAVPAVRLDLEDAATWPAALAGVDRVFLLRPPSMARASAMAGFLSAAEAAGVRRVAFLSVQGAGSNPVLPHRGIERLLEASTLSWTFLRAGYFHQNLLTAHRDDVHRGELALPAGRGRTALVDARDIAAAAVAALTGEGHARRAYELNHEALTWAEIAHVLSVATGRTVRYSRPGVLRYVAAQALLGRPPGLTLVTAGLYTATRWGLSARTTGDLAAVLGRPPVSFARFAADHAADWA